MHLHLTPYTAEDIAVNPRLKPAFDRVLQGDLAGAINELTDQARQHLPGAAFMLAALHYQTGQLGNALQTVEQAPELASHSQAWTIVGVSRLILNDNDAAWHALKRALDCDWKNLDAHRCAWSVLNRRGELNSALAHARDFILRLPAPASTRVDAPADLSAVTLCVVDCVYPELAARALRISMNACRFGAVKLLTSTGHRAPDIETVAIAHLGSSAAYSEFMVRQLPRYIDTPFVLVAQWDGYVLDATAWHHDFLNYDYLGATWTTETAGPLGPDNRYNVGNGGFSLRSARLMQAAAQLAAHQPAASLHPEDSVICRTMRPRLEQEFGIIFATGEVADRFSFEHHITGQPTFGFHGPINLAVAIADPAFSRFEFLP